MKRGVVFGAVFALILLAILGARFYPRTQPSPVADPPQSEANATSASEAHAPAAAPDPAPARSSAPLAATERTATPSQPEFTTPTTNKLERLTQIRETFRFLAAGNKTTALREAQLLTDENERETALLTLLTEWTQGDLASPRNRARAITQFGLEAGLGMELVKNPELALLWANELTDGAGRILMLQETARALLDSDPAAAFAFGEQFPPETRAKFYESLYEGWAAKDTAAAIQSAEQLPDAAQRDGAMQAIRRVAPVGIGAVLNMQDGSAIINDLGANSPAALSGQIHPGDRILGIAQGDNAWINAKGLSLQQIVDMIRGTPGSVVQLQLQGADGTPNSGPRTVAIVRDQIKFKKN